MTARLQRFGIVIDIIGVRSEIYRGSSCNIDLCKRCKLYGVINSIHSKSEERKNE